MNTAETSTPDAAVIIPHYNDVERLGRCLAALMQNEIGAAEIVVVDNSSTQSLDALRAAYPQVRFITEPQKGAALARNRGVRETTAPVLFFLDADCVPSASWMSVARMVAGRNDITGGRVDVFDETPPPRTGAEAFETIFAFDWRGYIEREGFTVTANMVTSRRIFLDVGDFINGISEDMDWCFRARDKGYKLVCEETLQVAHPSRPDWDSLRRKWNRTTRELFVLNGTEGLDRLRWLGRALSMPLSALAHVPRILRSPQLKDMGEKRRAIATLFRLRLQRMVWMFRQVMGLPV